MSSGGRYSNMTLSACEKRCLVALHKGDEDCVCLIMIACKRQPVVVNNIVVDSGNDWSFYYLFACNYILLWLVSPCLHSSHVSECWLCGSEVKCVHDGTTEILIPSF